MAVRRDVNQVIITGKIVTAPSIVTFKTGKNLCILTVCCCEPFLTATGQQSSHYSYFTVEVLGRNADIYAQQLRKDERVIVTGYLRADEINGVEKTRIRAYNIQKEI